MDAMLCLVDAQGTVYAQAGVESFAEVAREFGVNEDACQEYQFDLTTRRLSNAPATHAGELAAQDYVNVRVGSPERLMAFASTGYVPKRVLADLLNTSSRPSYLDACARIERGLTEACTAKNEPCLESGCSVEHTGEICLQPLLNAGVEYHQACAAEWIKLFQDPANRIDSWKN